MKKFSKFHLTALTLAGLMVVTTASVGAASVYKNITARQNTAMTVKVDGTALTMKDDDGDSLYPLTYDGNTYLPAEQLASAVGYNATSDDDSVSLTRKNTVSTFPAASGDIGSEKAKSIALNHAGVTSSTAKFVKVERDRDDGRLLYEVELYAGNKEYDYEILASDGTILSYDADIEGYYLPSSSKGATSTSSNRNASSSGLITRDRAKEIALQHAGLSSSGVNFDKAEFDHDDGRAEYEIEFHHNFREYEYTIDAASGTILEAERD